MRMVQSTLTNKNKDVIQKLSHWTKVIFCFIAAASLRFIPISHKNTAPVTLTAQIWEDAEIAKTEMVGNTRHWKSYSCEVSGWLVVGSMSKNFTGEE